MSSADHDARFHAVIDALDEGLMIQGGDGRVLDANAAACRILGLSRNELVRDPPVAPQWTAVRPDGQPFPTSDTPGRAALRTGQPQQGVVMGVVADDGSTRWVEVGAAPVAPSDGFPEASIVVSIRDITERRESEKAIAFQTELLRAAGQAVIATDLRGRIIYWNPAADGLYGWTKEQVIGEHYSTVVPSTIDLDFVPEMYQRMLEGRSWSGRFEVYRRDGGTVPVLCVNTPLFDAAGKLVAVMAVSTDLTELVAAEQDRAYLSAIVESSNDAIVAATLDGVITGWNAAAERLFGYTAEEVTGQSLTVIGGPRPTRALIDSFSSLGRIDSPTDVMAQQHTRDGRVIDIALTVSPVRDPAGVTIGISAIIRDITAQVRLAAEAEEHRRRLVDAEREAERHGLEREASERANRMKDEFLSRMSHELRTPLNAVLGFSQVLLRGDLGTQDRESVAQIHRAGRHLLGLIDEVLDISIIESGALQLTIEPVLVLDLTASAAELVESAALARGITVTNRGTDRTLAVSADRQRTLQIMVNLLSNAVKYNCEGGTIDITATRMDERTVRIAVTDSGPGIAEADLGRLFVPFDRLGAERTDVEGTGVGLALSRTLAHRMDATMGVTSAPGRGSTFWCDLPLSAAVDQAWPAPADVVAPPTDRRSLVVLYVEDNRASRRLVQLALETTYDLSLLTAVHGRLGIELARHHRPDLILLDLNLPDLSGAEVLAELRDDPRTERIPVAMLSADATSASRSRLLEAGAAYYLTKPLDLDEFDSIVADLSRGRQLAPGGHPQTQ